MKEWQSRPLDEIYAVVFLDAIRFRVSSDGPEHDETRGGFTPNSLYFLKTIFLNNGM
ncbi:MAG: hypothetical protein R3Y53_03760 [Bacillota bacterium]